MGTFNDKDYLEKVLGVPENPMLRTYDDNKKINEACKKASEIRQFETELFWKRGTYYWAFILAAFTAHFSLLAIVLKNNNTCCQNTEEILQGQLLTYDFFLNFSYLVLFCLAGTAFICFFFCLAWTLMNKGSKFWQKNWEQHVNQLEKAQNRKLFATYLNPDNSEYKKCFLHFSAYDYSVSKLVLATSILLTLVSLFITFFYIALVITKYISSSLADKLKFENIFILALTGIIGLLILMTPVFYILMRGNSHTKKDSCKENRKNDRWYQYKEVNSEDQN